MSLNQTRDELAAFRRALERFNSSLQQSLKSLEREHSAVASMWQDSFRKDYDRQWESFGRNIDRYLSRDAQRYQKFLETKIRQLEAYLHG